MYSILGRLWLIFLIICNVACVGGRYVSISFIIKQPERCLRSFEAMNNPRHDYFPAISCNIVMTRISFFPLSLPRSLHLLQKRLVIAKCKLSSNIAAEVLYDTFYTVKHSWHDFCIRQICRIDPAYERITYMNRSNTNPFSKLFISLTKN